MSRTVSQTAYEPNQANGVGRDTSGDRLPAPSIRLASPDGPEVSDPLSIFNSVIGLLAASSQMYNDLIDLNTVPDKNTAALGLAVKAVKSFKASIHVLYKILKRFELNELPHPERASFIELDTLIGILTESVLAFSELDDLFLEATDESEPLSVSTTALCHLHVASIIDTAHRINNAETVITRLLSALQVGSEIEAVRHRDQAHEIVQRLIESDIDLADRMMQMQDVFGSRSLASRQRLEAIDDFAPPEYSVPIVHSEELPEYSQVTNGPENEDGSITIQSRGFSIFSGLTLADISILSLIPLPVSSGEVRYGVFYSNEYCRRVNEDLAEFVNKNIMKKNLELAKILGLRPVGSDWSDEQGFARRVGLQYDRYERTGGSRRSRPQPEIRHPMG